MARDLPITGSLAIARDDCLKFWSRKSVGHPEERSDEPTTGGRPTAVGNVDCKSAVSIPDSFAALRVWGFASLFSCLQNERVL